MLFLSDFNETRIFSTDFDKHANIKLHKSPSIGRRVVTDRRTDVTELIDDFRKICERVQKIILTPTIKKYWEGEFQWHTVTVLWLPYILVTVH